MGGRPTFDWNRPSALGFGRTPALPALLCAKYRLRGIKWCRMHRCSSNSDFWESGSSHTCGPPLDFDDPFPGVHAMLPSRNAQAITSESWLCITDEGGSLHL